MKADFMPDRDHEIFAFEENFVTKVPNYTATLEMDTNEIAESVAIIGKHMAAFSKMNAKKAELASAVEEKQLEKKSSFAEIRRIAQKIKACKKYTAIIGDDLAIIGPEIPALVLDSMKPILTASYNGNELILKFRKEGATGVNIYSRRGSEKDYIFLGLDTSSPYNDLRKKLDPGLPEQREYYAMYVDADKEIGKPSDVLKVVIP